MFASQVAYVVTGSGVALGMLIYDERHSPWFWAALAGFVLAWRSCVKDAKRPRLRSTLSDGWEQEGAISPEKCRSMARRRRRSARRRPPRSRRG